MNKIKDYFYKIVVLKQDLKGRFFFMLILGFLSKLFFICLYLRIKLYKKGILRQFKASVPVISVGNITAGGSGKTPFCIYLTTKLITQFGKRPAVLLRGYGALVQKPEARYRISEDPEGTSSYPEERGAAGASRRSRRNKFLRDRQKLEEGMVDEEAILRGDLKDAKVLVGKDRVRNANRAIEIFKNDCIILDDGFQHLRMQRDLDIVMMKSTTVYKEDSLLPAGLLREPYSSLSRSHIIVITDADRLDSPQLQLVKNFLSEKSNNSLVLTAVYNPVYLMDYIRNRKQDVSSLDSHVLAVSGIADPESFEFSLKKAGLKVIEHISYPDHHRYMQKDIDNIIESAELNKVKCMVTTEKDIFKILPFRDLFLNKGIDSIYMLKSEIKVDSRDSLKLDEKLYDLFNSKSV